MVTANTMPVISLSATTPDFVVQRRMMSSMVAPDTISMPATPNSAIALVSVREWCSSPTSQTVATDPEYAVTGPSRVIR